MPRILSLLIALVLVLALVAGCATPPLFGGSGGGARGGDADAGTGSGEGQVAYGPVGGATNSRLGYQRQETGSQAAPTINYTLQPEAGATTSASYPSLSSFTPITIIVMANSQREAALSADQIEKLAGVAEKAGDAAKAIVDASAGPAERAGAALAATVTPGVEPPK